LPPFLGAHPAHGVPKMTEQGLVLMSADMLP
jgi:hypothetical protein